MENENLQIISEIYSNTVERLEAFVDSERFKIDVTSWNIIEEDIVSPMFDQLTNTDYNSWKNELSDNDLAFFEYYYHIVKQFCSLNEPVIVDELRFISKLLGFFYFKNKKYELCLPYLEESVECYEYLISSSIEDNYFELGALYEGIAEAYSQTDQPSLLLESLEKAIKWYLICENEESTYSPETTYLIYELYKRQKEAKLKDKYHETKKQLVKRIEPRIKIDSEAKKIFQELFLFTCLYREYKTLKACTVFIWVVSVLFVLSNVLININGGGDLLLAVSLKKYDGSSVIDTYKEVKIRDDRYTIAMSLIKTEQYIEAKNQLITLLDELKKTTPENSKTIGQIHLKIADCYLALSDYKNAYEHYLNSYVTFQNMYGASSENANVVKMQIAACKKAMSDYDIALADTLDAYNDIKYFGNKIFVSRKLCRIMCEKGNFEEAVFWAEKSIDYFSLKRLAKRTTDSFNRQACESYRTLGTTYNEFGCNEKALESFIIAEEYFEKCKKKDIMIEYNLYNGLFCLYTNIDNIVKAEEYGIKCLELAQKADNKEAELSISVQLSSLKDDELAMLNSLKKSKEIFGEFSNCTAMQYFYIGAYYYNNEFYEKSLECCTNSLEIKKSLLDYYSQDTMALYSLIAFNYIKLDDYKNTSKFILDSIKVLETRNTGFNDHCVTLLIPAIMLLNDSGNNDYASALSEACYQLCNENGIKTMGGESIDTVFAKYRPKESEGTKEYERLLDLANEVKLELVDVSIYSTLFGILNECGMV